MPAKVTFLVGFGNRGFFPPKYMTQARAEFSQVLPRLGYGVLMMPEDATRLGAVETAAEGRLFAQFAQEHKEEYQGIIWTHPNFGNELGMIRALRRIGRDGMPILLQAYPDEMDKMGPEDRRDSFCGKFSTADVLQQYRVPFVTLPPHTVSPTSPLFEQNLKQFAAMCGKPLQEVGNDKLNPLDGLTLLAFGARTSPFFTCRYDENAAAAQQITIETVDLSKPFAEMRALKTTDAEYKEMAAQLRAHTNWDKVPPDRFRLQVKFAVVMQRYLKEFQPAAVGVRCWTEFQELMGISPCATMSYFNEKGIDMACEVDLGTAVGMYVMKLAGSAFRSCQDWNNNIGEGGDKLGFMHCGPHATSLLKPGHYVDTHGILDHAFGAGRGFGCIQGRFNPGPITIVGATFDRGTVRFYVTEGRVTEDQLPREYFGAGGVAEVPGLQEQIVRILQGGFKHHFAMGTGHVADRVVAMLRQHAAYEVTDLRVRP
jgi:L-fucose isomerase-like protein